MIYRHKKISYLALPILLMNLVGCAEIEKDYIERHCNLNSAYANGINDSKNNENMRVNYAQECPTDIARLNSAYKKGFVEGLARRQSIPVAMKIHVNNHARQCISDNFGNETCGFNCVKTPFKILCAQVPENNCVKNTFNDIKCGLNCRVDKFNDIKCDAIES